MDIVIRSKNGHAFWIYTQADLRREARQLAKGRGRIVRYWVEFGIHEYASLQVEVRRKDGTTEFLNMAI